MMAIPLVDLKAQHASIARELDEALRRVMASGTFILGPEVETCEGEIAAYLEVPYAVGVASGTDALKLALLACDIGPGDEVITTPFTFIATAEAIIQVGAKPVFVDIDATTLNIDVSRIEQAITAKTRALLPVHLFGQAADMDGILRLAERHGLRVIEDCAQALGAEHSGRRVGSLGEAGCFSFFPSKMLGALGDGGMVTTKDAEIAEKLRMLRNHGCQRKYDHLIHGFNSRLDELQAAILRAKLPHLEDWIALRQRNAAFYSDLLMSVPGIVAPSVAQDRSHVFNYYTVRLEHPAPSRDELQTALAKQGIATAVYYPRSLHLQESLKHLGYRSGDLPACELAQEQVISLPLYPELEAEEIRTVASALSSFEQAPAGGRA